MCCIMEAGHRLAYTRMCVFPTTIVDSTELTVEHFSFNKYSKYVTLESLWLWQSVLDIRWSKSEASYWSDLPIQISAISTRNMDTAYRLQNGALATMIMVKPGCKNAKISTKINVESLNLYIGSAIGISRYFCWNIHISESLWTTLQNVASGVRYTCIYISCKNCY